MSSDQILYIAGQLGLPAASVRNTLLLMNEGATIPFVARYRKEQTGNLDETQITEIQKWYHKLTELEERRSFILQSIEEQGKLSDELKAKIIQTMNPAELEDLYLPYKRKKKTRAEAARNAGLEPLAKVIMGQANRDIEAYAYKFVNDSIASIVEAIEGAKDIIAEWISEDVAVRDSIRHECRKYGVLHSEAIPKKKEEAIQYKDYFGFSEPLWKCPSHRFLAIMRGCDEGYLKSEIAVDNDRIKNRIERKYIKGQSTSADIVRAAISDSYKRLLLPSVETQIMGEFKDKADDEAIRVFAANAEQLLMAPPLGEKVVMAADPGFRTGAKIVVLDTNGNLLEYHTVFPVGSAIQISEARSLIKALSYKYNVQAVAIGNGTASRETKDFFENIEYEKKPEIYIVSESGASIYSASDVAREEFPELDITYRGAVSIGRRLMDPLAELVKSDPKSIGVGQYQHDVSQPKLRDALHRTVESCVNRVGVNVNTASKHLLAYISGLGPALAESIIRYRTENGNFRNRNELLKIPRLGQKAYELCAGFLRIREGDNVLDNTGVHPESYHVVSKMASDLSLNTESFINSHEARKYIDPEKYVSDKTGLPTILDILKELEKPGLDPRGQAQNIDFDKNVKSVDDLYEGRILNGIVTNLTNFGAFVDIGVKQDGLIHISQITNKFIKSPSEILSLGKEVRVKVTGIDKERNRINLSMKDLI